MNNLYLITLVILKCILPSHESEIELNKKNQVGFVFSMPKALIAGRNETVCLSTHHATLPAKSMIDFKIKENHFVRYKLIDSDHICFQVILPQPKNMREPQLISVRVQIELNAVIYSAHNQDPILLYPGKELTFLETDRKLYRSGDKVKMRILVLSTDLLPVNNYKISEVRLRNPLDMIVAIWQNITTELGLAHLEHQMSQDSLVGKWKIEANNEVRTFEINKFILPRFDVEINHPKRIYFDNPSIEIKVCSKYSYGRNVKGTAFIRITDSYNNIQPIENVKEISEGCASFVFTNDQLTLRAIKEKYSSYEPTTLHLHITATVTEHGTDKIEFATAKSLITFMPYNMKLVGDSSFLPGMLYPGKIQFTNINTDLSNEVVEVCYNLAIRGSWNYMRGTQCSNFTVGGDNTVQFHVLPLKSSVIHLNIRANSLNHTNIGDSFLAIRLYSSSNSYIYLEQINPENTKCRSFNQFTVQYTTDKLVEHEDIVFYYLIKTRDQIYKLRRIVHRVRKHYPNYLNDFTDIVGDKHKFVKLGSAMDKFVLKFKLDERIISKYQLLVYYVTANGETVAATKDVEVEPCLNNKVEANWSSKQTNPGGRATLSIKATSDSLCSISAVDKSTRFLSSSLFTLDTNVLFKSFLLDKESSPSRRKSCVAQSKKNQVAALTEMDSVWDLRKRKKRYVHSFAEDFDTYDTFNKFGTIVISNFKIVTKPCYDGPDITPFAAHNSPAQSLTSKYENQNEEKYVPIRSFFPDTWLWELVPVRAGNSTNIARNLPHTITNWVTNVMCVSNTEGVGFSETTEISGFQSFFVDVLTPYSIKRGETLYLHVTLFNYLNYSLPIRLSLGDSHGLKLVDLTNSKSVTYCVLANSTVTHIFEMRGTEIGKMNITILAELDSAYPGHCGPDVILNKRDVVFKTLQVEPEGYPMKITKSALICGSDEQTGNNISMEISIPEKIVPNTAKAKLILNADLLGQTIENLDELIAMPTGCGEQIMATLAPNFYIMKYLNATNNLTPSIKQKIMKRIKIGYQRILNYARKDGSFSAFGYHDPIGSMFLTVFVVRTLEEAKQYIYVDQKIIDRAVLWIYSNQLENGCFNTMLHVFQDMGSTSTENSTAALTSYVMISLLDAKIQVPETVQTNAKYCIRGHYHLDKYTLAISAYALFKVGWESEATRTLKKLLQLSNQQENMLWWSNKDHNASEASDIEITSYVLLSFLHNKTNENLAHAHSIVRWLSTKRGPYGGFQSTQDTVVGLNALTKYSTYINAKKIDLDIKVEAIKQSQVFKIKNNDRLKSKKIMLKENNNKITINIEGDGCVLAQVVQNYYLQQLPQSEAFKLDLEVVPVSNIDECSITTLSSCFSYSGPDLLASMAILEVNLPSGYIADRASLYNLVDSNEHSKVKMFEEIKNQVVLYFTKLGQQQSCITFNINRIAIVESKSASTIKLYDYYKPEYETVQFYKMKNECGINKSLTVPEIVLNATNSKTHEINLINDYINETMNETKKNMVKRNSNNGFYEMDHELEMPSGMEANVPMYTLPDRSKNTTKINKTSIKELHRMKRNPVRKSKDLNPNFVDKNIELEVPNGLEGNIPFYTTYDNQTRKIKS